MDHPQLSLALGLENVIVKLSRHFDIKLREHLKEPGHEDGCSGRSNPQKNPLLKHGHHSKMCVKIEETERSKISVHPMPKLEFGRKSYRLQKCLKSMIPCFPIWRYRGYLHFIAFSNCKINSSRPKRSLINEHVLGKTTTKIVKLLLCPENIRVRKR